MHKPSISSLLKKASLGALINVLAGADASIFPEAKERNYGPRFRSNRPTFNKYIVSGPKKNVKNKPVGVSTNAAQMNRLFDTWNRAREERQLYLVQQEPDPESLTSIKKRSHLPRHALRIALGREKQHG